MQCACCKQEIDLERLEALPHTRTCVGCSQEARVVGFMEYGHKTAGYVQIIRGDDHEGIRRARRAYKRAR